MIFPCKKLEDFQISTFDDVLGSVKDHYFDDEKWTVRYFVVQTGSWLNDRRVLLSAANLTIGGTSRMLSIDATREQVMNSPPIDTDRPVSRQREQSLHDHFGWPYYWNVGAVGGPGFVPMPFAGIAPTGSVHTSDVQVPSQVRTTTGEVDPNEEGDPHLRSVREVRGYEIAARDGTIGEVEDFLVDDDQWRIPYLVVDTGKWLPGRKIILAPSWIQAVSWSKSHVAVDLSKEEIKNSPAYDSDLPLNDEYSNQLFHHYGRHRPPSSQ